jgi:hypothetical protein
MARGSICLNCGSSGLLAPNRKDLIMLKILTFVGVGAGALLAAAPALSQSGPATAKVIADLLKDKKAETAKAPKLIKKIKDASTRLRNAKKEKKAYQPMSEVVKRAKIYTRNWHSLQIDPEFKKHQLLVERYKRKGCEKGVTSQTYRACIAEKAVIARLWAKPNVGLRHDTLTKERHAIVKLAHRHRQLKKIIKAETKIIRDNSAGYRRLRARVLRLQAQIGRMCRSRAARRSAEAMKHCHSIDWDGARRDLPPLGNVVPNPFIMTPNR